MAYNLKECNREQIYLMPPSLQEWLPEKDMAWFIIDVVEQMDLSAYYSKYRVDGRGQEAYDPSMMVALLLYAYSNGIQSSRAIERLCERDIGFKVIAGDEKPDHTTIARFRQENGKGIGVVLADAGYCSDTNIENTSPAGPECIIATKKDWKQRQAIREADPPRGRIPENLSLRERMERKLLTKRGRTLYKKRGQIVEPVFGQIKICQGILKFMRRGFEACAQEWKLICATHNLLKLWRSGKLAFNENC